MLAQATAYLSRGTIHLRASQLKVDEAEYRKESGRNKSKFD